MAALLTRLLGLGPGPRNWPNPGLPTADVPKPNAMDPMTWRFPLEPIFGPLPLAPTPAIDGINVLITACITHEKTSSDLTCIAIVVKACTTHGKPSSDLICVASVHASLLVSGPQAAATCGHCAGKSLANSGMQIVAVLPCCITVQLSGLCVSFENLPQLGLTVQA